MSTAQPVDLTALSAIVESGQTPVPYDPNGESLSPWTPVTAQTEEGAVRQVPKPRKVDTEALAKADLSPIAIGLQQVQPVSIPDDVHRHGNQLLAQIEALQQRGFELLDGAEVAEQHGDFGLASNLKIEAGMIWAQATPLRQELAIMGQQVAQALQFNDVLAFQTELLKRHPWASSRKEMDACIKWACKEYGATEAEILASHPRDLLAGAAAYEQAMKASGKHLSRKSAAEHTHIAGVKSRAEKLRAKNGRLTPQQQHQLVSEILKGIEV